MQVSRRELWSLVAWGFLFLRMARTGYSEQACALGAFLIGVATLYGLDALTADALWFRQWPRRLKRSFCTMFALHAVLCILLLIAGSLWGFQHVRLWFV
ncbi:MAG: hypothetical protein IJU76_07385 [Desulfovibrionaceae bacterium]|nr:hypothetical protein [Desulfovibrionaceae bacterium]